MWLLHTLRYLKVRQVLGRARWHWHRLLGSPSRFAQRRRPPWSGCRWKPIREFLPAYVGRNNAGSLARGVFSFINREQQLGWPPRWSCPELPKLWQYNLHYFDFIWALGLPDARALAEDWIEQHPLARGQVGWEPYPTSLRLMNWCTFFFGRHCQAVDADEELRRQLWGSLFLQAKWLSRHIESHLLGNHLLENAAALAIVGSCFSGSDADRWLAQGRRLLARELAEQVLPDGLHFERSPMYHCRLLHVLLLLWNAAGEEVARPLVEPIRKACAALRVLRHPDGRLALLNDSAFGIYHEPDTLLDHADSILPHTEGRSSTGPLALPAAGYYGYRLDGDHVVCDAGPIGPDYIPGHAHGDMLSFELSLDGFRVFTDSGVSDYERSDTRRYCRSTAAHNTVELGGEDQCEFWAAFRVGRRGRPRDVEWEPLPDGFRLTGWHDGYMRLAGRPRHERLFMWHRDGVLLIRDRVTGKSDVDAVARYHLHPDCAVAQLTDASVRIDYPGGYCTLTAKGVSGLSVEQSWYCPEFGQVIPRRCICLRSRGQTMEWAVAIVKGAGCSQLCLTEGATVGNVRYGW